MGIFVSVRGWVEMGSDALPLVRHAIESGVSLAQSYRQAWLFSTAGGFSEFVFFGCTVREEAVSEIEAIVRAISRVAVVDGEFTDFPCGEFQLEHELEEGRVLLWSFRNGVFNTNSSADA